MDISVSPNFSSSVARASLSEKIVIAIENDIGTYFISNFEMNLWDQLEQHVASDKTYT